MYGYIAIRIARNGRLSSTYTGTTNYKMIYDTLRFNGYDHEEAENIASWASDAPYGSEYENDYGDEIVILEGD